MAESIRWENDGLVVPDHPIIPFIEGDGTGADIWRASRRVLDAAVERAFGGRRKIEWLEALAGEKAFRETKGDWLPQATVDTLVKHRVSIKGPLTTPVGGGIRSLNVTLRQLMDLYQCIRPVKYYRGVPSPMKAPEKVDMTIFRENTEDVYAGVEWKSGSPEAKRVLATVNEVLGGKKKVREDSGIGLKPISPFGTKRLVRAGIKHAIAYKRKSVTLVHKGNIMKFTEGAFRDWGYEVATQEFRDACVTERESWILDNKEKNPSITTAENAAMIEPGIELANEAFRKTVHDEVEKTLAAIGASHGGGKWKKKLLVKDRIADSMFQQALLRPDEYDVLCTPNLNGDYLSDALAAQVGGIGIAPGANVGDGFAVFEATHGTAPKYAGQDKVNPGSVILSGVMMLEYMGWKEAGDAVERGLQKTIDRKRVTYDFHRTMPGATLLKCSEFANAIIENM